MNEDDSDPENKLGRYILDAAGNPVPEPDLFKWGRWLEENFFNRQIARTELPDGHVVSTVFLGLDHGHGGLFGDREPILFETRAFNDYGSVYEEFCDARYATRAEALEGHRTAVDMLLTVLLRDKPGEE